MFRKPDCNKTAFPRKRLARVTWSQGEALTWMQPVGKHWSPEGGEKPGRAGSGVDKR